MYDRKAILTEEVILGSRVHLQDPIFLAHRQELENRIRAVEKALANYLDATGQPPFSKSYILVALAPAAVLGLAALAFLIIAAAEVICIQNKEKWGRPLTMPCKISSSKSRS